MVILSVDFKKWGFPRKIVPDPETDTNLLCFLFYVCIGFHLYLFQDVWLIIMIAVR